MSKKIVLGYDGDGDSNNAVDFATGLAKLHNGSLVVAHVLEWSPYSFLTPTELEERHKRRNEELERAKEAITEPLRKRLADSGVEVETTIKYGHVAETLASIAEEVGAAQLVVGRTGNSSLSNRLFGSVAASLAQAASVPVTIVP